ncbi:MAG: serine/threonine protein kinase, partial [Acetatifactor sp.]|nr:serine/threonine protein kinase [Acetatifactor sp.]
MDHEEIRVLKQSEKSIVCLVREQNGSQVFIRKILKGQHPIYQMLLDCPHPGLPKLQEVTLSEDSTTVIEEYIEGQASGTGELSEKQFLNLVRELCSVLEFLHGKGIIHRDIKPSNILLTKDGHVRLIDFDAARMPKEHLEQDTKLLGTRGFAPPEQYGFSQTDERTDIYALGATLNHLMGEKFRKLRYKRIIRKCMNLDPEKRYQSVKQVRQAFFIPKKASFAAVFLIFLAGCCMICLPSFRKNNTAGFE